MIDRRGTGRAATRGARRRRVHVGGVQRVGLGVRQVRLRAHPRPRPHRRRPTWRTPPDAQAEARSGGDATVFVAGRNAFGQPIDTLTREERRAFAVGNNFFNDNWVTAPASTEGRDGLGPLFNAQSCSSCHEFDGRGAPPTSADDPERGLLLRFSVVGPDGSCCARPRVRRPTAGPRDQRRPARRPHRDRADRGRRARTRTGRRTRCSPPPTRSRTWGTARSPTDIMVSPRIAPAVFGVGLLEAVPDDALLALADPDDADGDGISGRVNRVLDPSGDVGHRPVRMEGQRRDRRAAERRRVPWRHRDHEHGCTPSRTAPTPSPTCQRGDRRRPPRARRRQAPSA